MNKKLIVFNGLRVLGAVVGGTAFGCIGAAVGSESAKLLTAAGNGFINSVSGILTNAAYDDLKNMKEAISSGKRWQNHDLQKGLAMAFELTLKSEIERLKQEGNKGDFQYYLSDLEVYMKNVQKNLKELEALFNYDLPDKDKLVNFDNIFYEQYNEESEYENVWNYCQVVFSRCQTKWVWNPESKDLEWLRDELRKTFPVQLIYYINQVFKQEEFKEAWIGFQREILQRILGSVNHLGDQIKGLDQQQRQQIKETQELIKELMETKIDRLCEIVALQSDDAANQLEKLIQETVASLKGHISKETKTSTKEVNRNTDKRIKEVNRNMNNGFNSLAELLKGVKLERESSNSPKEEWSSFKEINEDFLDRIPSPTEAECQEFYRGAQPGWSMVLHGFTAERKDTKEILKDLSMTRFRSSIILGAGGEGKSTILMQTAISLFRNGFKVFYSTNANENEFINIIDSCHEPLAIVIDNADGLSLSRPGIALQAASESSREIKILLGARKNEWIYSKARKNLKTNFKDLHEIEIKKIDKDEAEAISELLISTHTIEDKDKGSLTKSLLNNSNQFLLAAMLTTTHGKSLRNILEDVVEKISEFDQSEKILAMMAAVVTVETIMLDLKENIKFSEVIFDAFKNYLGINRAQITSSLAGEVSFQIGKNVQTRHEIISKILYDVLFDPDKQYSFSEKEIASDIIIVVAETYKRNWNKAEIKLLWLIPQFYTNKYGYEYGIELFRISTEYNPYYYVPWMRWADIEITEGNIGEVDQEGSARYLLYNCLQYSENNYEIWLKWADFEARSGNIGSFDRKYCARWIFANGADKYPSAHHLFVSWANMEKEEKNLGSIKDKYTARWILHEISQRNKSAKEIWTTWAEMEYEAGNVGENSEEEGTALWCIEQGMKYAPSTHELWLLRARGEMKRDNIGHANDEGSALWCIAEGLKLSKNEPELLILWGKIERERGSVGDSKTEGSILWHISEGLKRNKNRPELWILWAEIERDKDNIGTTKEEGSALWCIAEGLKYNKNEYRLWLMWAEIEKEKGNIGREDEEGSALWYLAEGIKYTDGNSHLWALKAEIEEERDNIGNAETEGSAVWCLLEALKHNRRANYYWYKLAQIEIDRGNIGSAQEQKSALWYIQQGLRNCNNKDMLLELKASITTGV